MSRIAGSSALVTGGASGIGYLIGRELLERGAARLVVWDIDDEALRRTATELGAGGRTVAAFRVDVTDPERVRSVLDEMRQRDIAIDILVNNAGIVVGRDFAAHTQDDIARTMAINALAPMQLAREVLPGMIERGRGHIVNIASAAGLLSNPGMSVYCASKWALTGWSDSLRLEMERSATGVRVTTVAPFYIDTGMFAGVRSPIIPILRPDPVARAIVAAIARDRIFLRLPWIVNLLPAVRGLLPARWFDVIAGDWLGVYRSMNEFRGRGN